FAPGRLRECALRSGRTSAGRMAVRPCASVPLLARFQGFPVPASEYEQSRAVLEIERYTNYAPVLRPNKKHAPSRIRGGRRSLGPDGSMSTMNCGINKMALSRPLLCDDCRAGLRATSKATMCPEINAYENYVPIPKTNEKHVPSRIRGA